MSRVDPVQLICWAFIALMLLKVFPAGCELNHDLTHAEDAGVFDGLGAP